MYIHISIDINIYIFTYMYLYTYKISQLGRSSDWSLALQVNPPPDPLSHWIRSTL